VRVLSATNADLNQVVKSGIFREDLFYRLNVVNIHMPPLRERSEDVPLLAAHFIHLQNQKFGTQVKGLEKDAMQILCAYDWPGNIRQLKNVIEACMAMEGEDYISSETLMQFVEVSQVEEGTAQASADGSAEVTFNAALEHFEAELLKGLLKKHGGNIEAAARTAGMNMATMYRKIKRYGIRKEDYS
jgi:DNA-binding NtrC family response regulator